MLSRTTKILVIALVALAAGLHWFLSRDSGDNEIPADAVPPGRWHRAVNPAGGDPADADPAQLARVLSLPYLEGKVEATANAGVVRHDPSLAWEGLNLYCSGHAPEAILMDMQGGVLHRWRFAFDEAFPNQRGDAGSRFFRRVALLPGGDLLALYQGWGLIRIDRESSLVWALAIEGFNDFFVDGERILLLSKTAGILPEINGTEPVLEDFVVELTATGEVGQRLSLLRLFRASEYAGLLATMSTSGDILHSNTVTVLEKAASEHSPFNAGQLLVSLREVSVIGVIDPAEPAAVIWAARGPWKGQHEPILLPDGNILLLDNLGALDGNARAIEIEPESGSIVWSYSGSPSEALVSPEGGSLARLPNGNTLITASETGRAVEVTPTGTIVWEFLSPHRAGPHQELVATLWEVIRLGADAAEWLSRNPP